MKDDFIKLAESAISVTELNVMIYQAVNVEIHALFSRVKTPP